MSSDAEKISGRMLHILQGYQFAGTLYLINARRVEIGGLKCYPSLSDLPETPDLAIVLVPSQAVLGVVKEAVSMAVPHVIIYSSGFSEAGETGRAMAADLLRATQGSRTRIMGPNSEGLIQVPRNLPLSFSPVIDPARQRARFRPGTTAVVSQSGGIGFAVADHLERAGIGIHTVVTTGNEIDLELSDFVRYFATQPDVENIFMFLEGLNDPAAFVEACTLAHAHGKLLAAIKVGESAAGRPAVTAHTGKVPDENLDFKDLFRSAGVVPLADISDVIDVIQSKHRLRTATGRRVAVVTVSGGGGIWVTDQLATVGLQTPRLTPELTASLRKYVQQYASLLNPIDVTAQAIYDGAFAPVLREIVAADEIDAVLIVGTFGYDHKLLLDHDFRNAVEQSDKPIVVFSYTPPSNDATMEFETLGIPWFTSPRRAALALAAVCGRVPSSEASVSSTRDVGRRADPEVASAATDIAT
ncbi:acyl-CoA synthetase (NDP forming) [Alicyclobacillus cycloheptanicus]|uniref:Acyl-CoA synthetase (NDP forming) n=1 Tax=Alicyclobacillus cycloheptanicus TaxID=1457 RepID=A0ABT9XP32_9BACL|nr:acyl-CoA synthetase (NDP forming) [Alicyclobacillus cycloheptanicus]